MLNKTPARTEQNSHKALSITLKKIKMTGLQPLCDKNVAIYSIDDFNILVEILCAKHKLDVFLIYSRHDKENP